jgi:hypothetical protein
MVLGETVPCLTAASPDGTKEGFVAFGLHVEVETIFLCCKMKLIVERNYPRCQRVGKIGHRR